MTSAEIDELGGLAKTNGRRVIGGVIALSVASLALGGAAMYFWAGGKFGAPVATPAAATAQKPGTVVSLADEDTKTLRPFYEALQLAQRDKLVAESGIPPTVRDQITAANRRIDESTVALGKALPDIQKRYKCEGCQLHQSLTYLIRP